MFDGIGSIRDGPGCGPGWPGCAWPLAGALVDQAAYGRTLDDIAKNCVERQQRP